MKKTSHKSIIGIFLIAFIVTVLYTMPAQKEMVCAAEGDIAATVLTEGMSKEDAQNYIGKKVPTYGEQIFVGWYEDDEYTKPVSAISDEIETYYPKFVDKEVLSVKFQKKEFTDEDGVERANLRMVSTVINNHLLAAGFQVEFNDNGNVHDCPANTVYKRIIAGSNKVSGVAYNFSPKLFDTESEYFMTHTLLDINATNFAKFFQVRPYWKTMDGMMVYGVTRFVTVNDSDIQVVSVPAKGDITNSMDGATYEITSNSEAISNVAMGDLLTAHYDSLSGWSCLRVPLVIGEGGALPSASTVTATTATGVSYSTVYRNTETSYTASGVTDFGDTLGQEDISWYTEAGGDDGTDYIIATTADLFGLSRLVTKEGKTFSGKKIYVVADLKVGNSGSPKEAVWYVNNTATIPSIQWIPIGNTSTYFQGTFDGCGHTISGLYTDKDTEGNGLFSHAKNAVVRNFNLTNSLFIGSGQYGGSIIGCGEADVNSIYTNAHIDIANTQVGGIIGRVTDGTSATKCNITNCQYDGYIAANPFSDAWEDYRIGGLVGNLVYGETNISGCLFSGTIYINVSTANRFAGIVGHSSAATLSISDCVSAGMITKASGVTSANQVGAILGNASSTKNTIGNNVYATTDCYSTLIGTGSVVSTSQAIINNITIDGLIGAGAYHSTNLDFVDGWALQDGGLPVPKTLADADSTIEISKDITYIKGDTSWYTSNPETTTFEIADAADLFGLAVVVNNGWDDFAGDTINITSDIDLNPGWTNTFRLNGNSPVQPSKAANLWTPIGNATTTFKGTIGGESSDDIKTISGLYFHSMNTSQYVGLFGYTDGCTVQNIALKNGYIYSRVHNNGVCGTATVIGRGDGILQQVYSDVDIYAVNASAVAGFIGLVNDSTGNTGNTVVQAENCWYDGLMVFRNDQNRVQNAGGAFGYILRGTVSLTNSLFTGEMNYSNSYSSAQTNPIAVGGVIGRDNTTTVVCDIQNCVVDMPVTVVPKEGITYQGYASVIGAYYDTKENDTLTNVYSTSSDAAVRDRYHETATIDAYVVKDKVSWTTLENLDSTLWELASKGEKTLPVLQTLKRFAGWEPAGDFNITSYLDSVKTGSGYPQKISGTARVYETLEMQTIDTPQAFTDPSDTSSGNYYSSANTGAQGGYFDGRYMYQSFIKFCYNKEKIDNVYVYENGRNEAYNIVKIVKWDTWTHQVVAEKVFGGNVTATNWDEYISSNSVWLNHANDMTIVDGSLLIANNNPNYTTVTYLDADTLEYEKKEEIDVALWGIDYNSTKDRYLLGKAGEMGFYIFKPGWLGGDFGIGSSMDYYEGHESATGYTKQTICCDDKYIYCLYYGNGTNSPATDAVIVYDWSGNFVTFIETDFDNAEPENVTVANGVMHITAVSGNSVKVYRISNMEVME